MDAHAIDVFGPLKALGPSDVYFPNITSPSSLEGIIPDLESSS